MGGYPPPAPKSFVLLHLFLLGGDPPTISGSFMGFVQGLSRPNMKYACSGSIDDVGVADIFQKMPQCLKVIES